MLQVENQDRLVPPQVPQLAKEVARVLFPPHFQIVLNQHAARVFLNQHVAHVFLNQSELLVWNQLEPPSDLLPYLRELYN